MDVHRSREDSTALIRTWRNFTLTLLCGTKRSLISNETPKELRMCHSPVIYNVEFGAVSLIECCRSVSQNWKNSSVLYNKPVRTYLHFSTVSSGRLSVECSVSLVPEVLY